MRAPIGTGGPVIRSNFALKTKKVKTFFALESMTWRWYPSHSTYCTPPV